MVFFEASGVVLVIMSDGLTLSTSPAYELSDQLAGRASPGEAAFIHHQRSSILHSIDQPIAGIATMLHRSVDTVSVNDPLSVIGTQSIAMQEAHQNVVSIDSTEHPTCNFCGRSNFKVMIGLNQHMSKVHPIDYARLKHTQPSPMNVSAPATSNLAAEDLLLPWIEEFSRVANEGLEIDVSQNFSTSVSNYCTFLIEQTELLPGSKNPATKY